MHAAMDLAAAASVICVYSADRADDQSTTILSPRHTNPTGPEALRRIKHYSNPPPALSDQIIVGDTYTGMSAGGVDGSPSPARRPSRYESQKRRDWQTFTRYLGAHRPPLQLHRCSGAHVLEFLRYLDRFGKTRVHAQPCPAYGGGGGGLLASPPEPCQCPLRQAWGSLDALVGRLRAAFDERHGTRGGGETTTEAAAAQPAENAGAAANPFAARAVRLYLRDVRDAQARARGISYSRRKKRRNKQQPTSTCAEAAAASNKQDDGAAGTTSVASATPPPHPYPTPPPLPPPTSYLTGVPFECCDHYGSVFGVPAANGSAAAANSCFYLPLLFNSFV
jgi:hypothetical protein